MAVILHGGPFDGRTIETTAPCIVFPTLQSGGFRSDEYLRTDREHASWFRAFSHVRFESDETIAAREAFNEQLSEYEFGEFVDQSFV